MLWVWQNQKAQYPPWAQRRPASHLSLQTTARARPIKLTKGGNLNMQRADMILLWFRPSVGLQCDPTLGKASLAEGDISDVS